MCISAAACRRCCSISQNDPDETRNVADDPAYRSARLDMAERLLAWRAEHLDQSLALSELTDDGMVGEFHSVALK